MYYESRQSAHKNSYITETALIRLKDPIILWADPGKVIQRILLDLYAAFDGVDYNIFSPNRPIQLPLAPPCG